MFFALVGSFHRHTDTRGAEMATRDEAIQAAAEALVYWTTAEEAQEAA